MRTVQYWKFAHNLIDIFKKHKLVTKTWHTRNNGSLSHKFTFLFIPIYTVCRNHSKFQKVNSLGFDLIRFGLIEFDYDSI